MLPAACLSALLCPLLVWPLAAPFDVSTIDLLKQFGTAQFGLGLVFLTVGGQMVSATETALIDTLGNARSPSHGCGYVLPKCNGAA